MSYSVERVTVELRCHRCGYRLWVELWGGNAIPLDGGRWLVPGGNVPPPCQCGRSPMPAAIVAPDGAAALVTPKGPPAPTAPPVVVVTTARRRSTML